MPLGMTPEKENLAVDINTTAEVVLKATDWERSFLLGLAKAESNFQPDAVGDEGKSFGLWQIEKSNENANDIKKQTENALKRVRSSASELSKLGSEAEKFYQEFDRQLFPPMDVRRVRFDIMRAAWQLPESYLSGWVKAKIQQLKEITNACRTATATLPESGRGAMVDAVLVQFKVPQGTAGTKEPGKAYIAGWGVKDFIDYAVEKKASRTALEDGHTVFSKWMKGFYYSPVDSLGGKRSSMASRETDGTGSLGGFMSWLGGKGAGVVDSFKAGADRVSSVVLPIIGGGLGILALAYVINKVWHPGKKK